MAYSSILGADVAPQQPGGRESEALGPSASADSDAVGTGERGSVTPGEGREGGDILPDRVVNLAGAEVTPDESEPLMTDLDEAGPEAGEETIE
jgi:hypothetical protein